MYKAHRINTMSCSNKGYADVQQVLSMHHPCNTAPEAAKRGKLSQTKGMPCSVKFCGPSLGPEPTTLSFNAIVFHSMLRMVCYGTV